MKAIDKGNSPLWVRILVWILVAGLLAAGVFMAVGVFMTWDDEPAPMTITADDLPPEVLADLEAQMADLEANQGEDEEIPEYSGDEAGNETEDDAGAQNESE
ncbi:MAG: hypothetical protein FWE26_00780 [Coriobacteriia bacterium]|nr:hypothetical protein [Coriobacteriia bacterium]MCL2870156.1 hypothetical protein [Coriobacteriia bacterium]